MLTFLEVGLLRVAFPFITPEVLDAAERLEDEMEAQNDFIAWGGQNTMFHNSFYEPARRFLTLDRLARLRRQVDRYVRAHMEFMREESERQHRRILEAIRSGDLTTAVSALTFHLEESSRGLQAQMKPRK
jgi:DNA-binding GntR family transcriptional regulator